MPAGAVTHPKAVRARRCLTLEDGPRFRQARAPSLPRQACRIPRTCVEYGAPSRGAACSPRGRFVAARARRPWDLRKSCRSFGVFQVWGMLAMPLATHQHHRRTNPCIIKPSRHQNVFRCPTPAAGRCNATVATVFDGGKPRRPQSKPFESQQRATNI